MSEDIFSSAMELSVADTKVEETKTEALAEVEETKAEPVETLETLENLSEKTEDNIPLKKFMAEKNARRDAEAKAKELEAEISNLRNSPKSDNQIKLDVSYLSDKHGIDEEVLRDILEASYSMSKDKIKQELEQEFNPKLAEFEGMKKEKEKQVFETKFQNTLNSTLEEMPEFKDLVDTEDLKTWIRSGQYSKLSLPQLIEQKYGKFVVGKKAIENNITSGRETALPSKTDVLTDEQFLQLDTNPELKKRWAEGLEERLRRSF